MATIKTVGRFEIVRLIGHGGMGSVYLARDPLIDRLLAIKLLKDGVVDQTTLDRFTREARSAGRLRHPNIVTIFDVGEHLGQPFLAMEYVPGETLAALIARQAPLPLGRKLKLIEDLCTGLGYAHRFGVVHRDIKPANVIIDPEGVLKILDFGIARIAEPAVTQVGVLLGTLNYMSPEQLRGEVVDQRSDVFAVGAVAYELLFYRMAFPGSVQDGLLHRILQSEPALSDVVESEIDPRILDVIRRALDRHPSSRYQELESMRRDVLTIRRALAGGDSDEWATIADPEAITGVWQDISSGSLPDQVLVSAPTPSKTRLSSSQPSAGSQQRRNRTWRAAVATAVVSVISLGIWAALPSVREVLSGSVSDSQTSEASEGSKVDRIPDPLQTPASPGPATESAAPGVDSREQLAQFKSEARVASPAAQRKEEKTGASARASNGSTEPAPPRTAPIEGRSEPPSPASGAPSPPPAGAVEPVSGGTPAPKTAAVPPPPVAPEVPETRAAREEMAIRETLRQYQAAYQRLDAQAVRKLQPTLSENQMRQVTRDFEGARSYSIVLSGLQIAVQADADTATASAEVTRTFTPKIGTSGSRVSKEVYVLRKSGGSWVIESVER